MNWGELEALDGPELRRAAFEALKVISGEIQDRDLDDQEVLGSVPRLADLIEKKPDLSGFRPVLSTLARSVGLWNYIDPVDAEPRDRVLAEAASVDIGKHVVLHREQIEALNILLEGKNLILSAPTSFGKSILIDVLLATGRYDRVAIILPTIALLDEFRKRLTERFGDRFSIVMHHSQTVADSRRAVFLGTQERLINRDDVGAVDLLVVDEFYKLDPNRQDDRSLTLNAAVYKLLHRARQFFFLGPNIENIRFDPDGRWRFQFLRTRFSTVAVDTVDLRRVADKFGVLTEEAFDPGNWPALIFVSGPDAATTLAGRLSERSELESDLANELADWIVENYGSNWGLSKIVRSGIGLHHGRVPRSLAAMFVKMFNDERLPLPVLLCTSTLIEGVNTAAKSVLIYDRVINRASYDFFTFSNIRGRAGRLGQHHIGRVFLFHTPPGEEEVEVAPPLFQDLDDAPDELVVHIEQEEVSAANRERIDGLANILGLAIEDMRRLSSLGFETLAAVKGAVEGLPLRAARDLVWAGQPDYEQIVAITTVACIVRRPNDFGAGSAAQLNRFIRRLRAVPTFKGFFAEYNASIVGYENRFENIFRFLRSCEHTLPEIFSAVEKFAKLRFKEVEHRVDYSFFVLELSRWFKPEVLKALEEQGVPIQISERFYTGDSLENLSAKLRAAARDPNSTLSTLEREWIENALPEPRQAIA